MADLSRAGRLMDMKNNEGDILRIEGLKKWFPVKKGFLKRTVGHVKAVDNIGFSIKKAKSLALVGESGCGKTTTARTIIRLIEPTKGRIHFDGKDVTEANKKKLKNIRKDMAMIFQDPFSSLNPRMTVGQIVEEPLIIQKKMKKAQRQEYLAQLLEKVGLSYDYINRYPHEFSGGQRQRIGIARALVLKPKLIIADEPVSALDVSVQAQILNLLKDLQDEMGLTYLFIAHDLAVVKFFCDQIAVMYLGEIVEKSDSNQIYDDPKHPYTKMLISAVPKIDFKQKISDNETDGKIRMPAKQANGCLFYDRCKIADEYCENNRPTLTDKNGDGHFTACWKCV